MHRGIREIRFFLVATVVLAVVLLCVLMLFEKTTIHLSINDAHAPLADTFFKYFTYVGDGVFVALGVLVAGIIGFKRWRWNTFIFGWGILIVSGGIAQLLKRLVFYDAMRPIAFLQDKTLHLVSGVEMHHQHSFPSGHTTAAFAFFGFLSLFCFRNKPVAQILCALAAFTVGYSRMYLSQHFMEDVFAGMLLGTSCVVLAALIARKTLKS